MENGRMLNRPVSIVWQKAKNETNVAYHSLMSTLAFATLTFILLTACGGTEEPEPIAVPPGTHAGALTAVEPCKYVTGDVEYPAECGTLAVSAWRATTTR